MTLHCIVEVMISRDNIHGSCRSYYSTEVVGGTLAEHTFLFFGAGEAGTGIAELIALEMSKQYQSSFGRDAKENLACGLKGINHNLGLPNVNPLRIAIKPTVLIGSSGVERTFTKEKPLIMALSNPTSQSVCTAEEAYTWSQGHAIFASGSPFDPMEYNGKANNAYIFPGIGLGLVISGTIRVHDEMLLAAWRFAEALAGQVTKENFDKVGRTFTKEVVEAMASFNEKPLIMALSNPTSQSECTVEEAYSWSQGHAIFASGSPIDPVEYNGKLYLPGK
ncbi:unnamed protein product [Camellia sinensis]